MKKWGVWLISISFFIGAITNYFDIITQRNPPHGFMGFSFFYESGLSPASLVPQFDVMALIGLCVNLYIAYNLSKFRNDGRIGALIVLWLSTLLLGFSLFYIAIKISTPLTSLGTAVNYLGLSYNINQPGTFLTMAGSVFTFYIIQIYFLMRKDVKAQFQKPVNIKVESN